MQASRARSGGARTSALLNISISGLIVLLVSTFALVARQPSPPSIAEFAPQAQRQITDTQADQAAAGEGDGPGGSGEGGSATTTTSTSTTLPGDPGDLAIDVPRVRRCVGNPPRQTEDPQSPPCLAYWEGDNGGATAKGVTGKEIKIAYPDVTRMGIDPKHIEALFEHFNRRYEFYGRRLTMQRYEVDDNVGQSTPEYMNRDAAKVSDELGSFASLLYLCCEGEQYVYYDALAERRVISADGGGFVTTSLATEADLAKRRPYQWNYLPAFDTSQRNSAEVVCKNLKDNPPQLAQSVNPVDPPKVRSFGILRERTKSGKVPEVSLLKEAVAGCGVRIEAEASYLAQDNASLQNAVSTMQNARVTTVICYCDAYTMGSSVAVIAEGQRYQPEWFFPAHHEVGLDGAFSTWPVEQAEGVFGLMSRNKAIRPTDRPWYAAVKEVDPSLAPYYAVEGYYASLLLLASGIQAAGPELTPETFERGLQRTRFANPGAGDAPYFQGAVGFGPTRRSMMNDYTLVWWNPSYRSEDSGTPGAFCYVELGKRWSLGRWPAGQRPFKDASAPCK